jgi:hypothetical protein
MITTKTLSQVNVGYAVKFIVLLTLATAAPLVGVHSQWITGPIVNMALILAVFLVGIRGALLIGILPSTIALGTGLLPAVLAPMIPFIIISNTLLILVIDWFRKAEFKNKFWVGLIFGAGTKYLFLFVTSGVVMSMLLNQALASKVAVIMSWPQFFTAVIGGALAYGALKFLRK